MLHGLQGGEENGHQPLPQQETFLANSVLLQVWASPGKETTATAALTPIIIRPPMISSCTPIHTIKRFTQCLKLKTFWEIHRVLRCVRWCCFCRRQAPVAAVFAGSPQLMGVIKLCTGWMVSSLPLYNDDDLLKRNENVSIQFHKCMCVISDL